MNLDLPTHTAKKLEQLRRSLGTTRVEALDRVLDNYLEDKQLLALLKAPNPATAHMTEDEVYEIVDAAVKRAREERRSNKGRKQA